MRLVGHLDGRDRSAARTARRPALSTTAVTRWPESRSTISTTSPAAGAAGVMGFSLTNGCIGARAQELSTFFAAGSESRAMAKRTLILGCATGIGNAGARLLAARGDRLALGDIDGPGVDALAAELGAIGVPRRCRGYRRFAGIRRGRRAGARRSRLRVVERRRADRRLGRAGEPGRLRPLICDQRARARRRLRRRGAASARLGRRRDLHHRLQLRAALGAAARARTPSRRPPALALARQVARDYSSRGHPRQRALPGLDRHAVQHAGVGELRRPRALPRRRFRGSCRWGASARPRRPGGWPASCSPTTPRT